MATSSDLRIEVHKVVDQLNEEQLAQAAQVLGAISHDSLEAILRDIPGLRMPEHWPPRFPEVEPLVVSGEPASEQLVRERR
jgi:hypothetical protein